MKLQSEPQLLSNFNCRRAQKISKFDWRLTHEEALDELSL